MYYRSVFVWACFVSLTCLAVYAGNNSAQKSFSGPMMGACLFGWLPFLASYLKFKTTHYYVTNLRIYLTSGILSRTIRDIPLSKVNDVVFSQGILDRLNKTGRLRILTGNDAGAYIKQIERPEEFREAIATLIVQAGQKAS
jgi:uncharacterized membrane protein YdbT with pleckstrin-like domain